MTFIQHTIELYFLGPTHHFANNNRDILYIYMCGIKQYTLLHVHMTRKHLYNINT